MTSSEARRREALIRASRSREPSVARGWAVIVAVLAFCVAAWALIVFAVLLLVRALG